MEAKKIALFHPWIKSRGGAEKFVLKLLENSKHQIDLYTWVYEPENTFAEFKNYKINIIAPKIAKKLSRMNVLRGFIFPLGIVKKIPLEKYDKLLISTSGMAEFITFRNKKKGNTLAYSHTPLREASKEIVKWNLENRYRGKFLRKSFYLAAVKVYRILERRAWRNLDIIMFNSKLSKSRAEERNIIGTKKIQVVNPPIDFSKFENLKPIKTGKKYFLYVSRINPPKRQDVLLKAWKEFVEKFPSYHLIIAGTSENKKYFKNLTVLAKETKNVEIKTDVSDEELKNLVSGCIAGIFLGYQEDFGILPLEILCANKPLIAVDEGGYVELIEKHPNFHKIKERHNNEELISEVEKSLEQFVTKGINKKPTRVKIKTKDFIREIDKILDEI